MNLTKNQLLVQVLIQALVRDGYDVVSMGTVLLNGETVLKKGDTEIEISSHDAHEGVEVDLRNGP